MQTRAAVEYFLTHFLGSQNEEQLVEPLVQISHVKELTRKEILFFEDDPGETVFFLVSGTIKLTRTSSEGKEAIIHFVQAGELFAEILFFMQNRYPVTATALDKSVVLGFSTHGLQQMISDHPPFTMRLIGLLSRRLKYFVHMVEQLVNADVRERFLSYLKQTAETTGNPFTLTVPKGELATLLGTTPETFSRLLKTLSDEGVLQADGKTITLLNRD